MSRKSSVDGLPCDTISHHVIPTERAGALSVWVQGDLSLAQKAESRDSCCVFMTVHDVGVNHNSWLRFVNSPAMGPIREKAVFLHVDLLGQEDGAQELPFGQEDGGEELVKTYPTMQEIGEDLVNILDVMRVKVVVGLAEGAGANALLRFGSMHVSRCLGIVCINPNPAAATMIGGFLDRIKNLRGDKPLTAQQKQMNQKNVQKLLEAFEARSDIMPVVEKSKCETILMAGAKAEAHVKGIDAIFSVSDKTKTSMMKIDGVFTILDEAPGKLANAILLFTKGLGWLTSVDLPNVERRSSRDSNGGRRMSMEEYDTPNIRRLSLASGAGAAPKGSFLGTGKATGVVLEEFKPKPGNLEFVGGGDAAVAGNGPPETEVALAEPGLGSQTSVDLPNVDHRSSRDSTRGRRMSMEEYDTPNIRRFSLTSSGNSG